MALQKVVRNMLNTGISDSSDATAITIDSSENVTLGTVGSGASTATPVELNLGSTFADAAGSKSKMKLKLFEDTSSNILGFGISNAALEYHSNGVHTFYKDESEKVRIDSSGRLMIGTTTEGRANEGADMFTIGDDGSNNSGMTMRSGTSGYGSIYFSDATSGTGEYAGYIQYAHNTNQMLIATNSTTAMSIDSSGNVGIGTTSPSQVFEVRPNDDYQAVIGRARIGDLGYDDFAGFGHFDTGTNYAILQQDNGHTYVNAASGEDISFRIANSDKMQLLSNGRVVIGTGTSSNAGLLVSNADIRCTAAAVANDANSISMSQESANNSYIVSRGNSTSERGNIYLTVSRSNGGGGINGLIVASDGSVSKNSGSFKIDHPLESKKDTHHLVHSFVEGPQADNMYRGVVALENGTATINLDTVSGMTEGTFVALNTDIQCFTSNETDWDSVKGSISGNTLTISCQNTSSTATVSWLVIGERQDQHMLDADWTDENGKVIVEPLKESE